MSEHNDQEFAHPVPLKLLFGVFFALIFLTILTVLTAGLLPRPLGFHLAMTIATIKGFLVVAFFMHMWWEKGFNIIAFLSSFFFAALFIGLTLLDSTEYQDTISIYPREPDTVQTTIDP